MGEDSGTFSWHGLAVSIVAIKWSQDCQGSKVCCFGKLSSVQEALSLPAREMHMGAGGWQGLWTLLRGYSLGSVPGITSLAAVLALGWLQAVDATPFIPG